MSHSPDKSKTVSTFKFLNDKNDILTALMIFKKSAKKTKNLTKNKKILCIIFVFKKSWNKLLFYINSFYLDHFGRKTQTQLDFSFWCVSIFNLLIHSPFCLYCVKGPCCLSVCF